MQPLILFFPLLSFSKWCPPLERVKSFKYLSILLTHNLSWTPHIQAISSKARKLTGLIYRKSLFFPLVHKVSSY